MEVVCVSWYYMGKKVRKDGISSTSLRDNHEVMVGFASVAHQHFMGNTKNCERFNVQVEEEGGEDEGLGMWYHLL